MVEFHEDQPLYKRNLLSHSLLEHAKDLVLKLENLDLTSIDVSSSSSSYGSTTIQSHDSQDNQTHPKRSTTTMRNNDNKENAARTPSTQDMGTVADTISTEYSWFSILWTCQKKLPLKQKSVNQ